MKELLLEFLLQVLNETPKREFKAVKVTGSEERITTFGSKETMNAAIAAGTHRPYLPNDRNLPGDTKTPSQKTATGQINRNTPTDITKGRTTSDKKPSSPKKPEQKNTVSAPGGVQSLNSTNLAIQIRDGITAPGNDFSRYSEAVSVFISKYIADNPNVSDDEIMKHLTKLDCGSKTLSAEVGATIPKRFTDQYKNLKNSGAFTSVCSHPYSEAQNRARFMTMIVAKQKAQRMREAIKVNGMSGVNIDSFSGDAQSLQTLRRKINESTGKFFSETGEELSKEEVQEFINGFGTAKFPADTALVGTDQNGNITLIGFSDKKDLQAIINNSTVIKEFERNVELLDNLLKDKKISQEQYEDIIGELTNQRVAYEKKESELRMLTASPATALVELAETNPRSLNTFIKKAKNLSGGKDPAKYWNSRIGVFQRTAEKKSSPARDKEYLQWLRKAGWDGELPVSDTLALTAFAYKMKHMIEAEQDVPKDDQEILFRLDVVDKKELMKNVGDIRKSALNTLRLSREKLNNVSIQGIPLGTLIDGIRAWKGLHLDMGEYKGSLCMVAEDVVVDYKSIQECLHGLKSIVDFAKNLQIQTKSIMNKEYDIVTGENIEVFSVSPSGDRVNVGVRSIRSKDGPLGKLQTTWTYHPEFQSCLAGKIQRN